MDSQWIVYLYTRSAQFVSCCNQYIQINSLKKSSFLYLYIYSHQTRWQVIVSIFILIKPRHICTSTKLCKLQICYSNFQDNKLYIVLNYEFFFFSGSKTSKQTKTKAIRQRKLEISKFEIFRYMQFYCFLYYMYVICKYNR